MTEAQREHVELLAALKRQDINQAVEILTRHMAANVEGLRRSKQKARKNSG